MAMHWKFNVGCAYEKSFETRLMPFCLGKAGGRGKMIEKERVWETFDPAIRNAYIERRGGSRAKKMSILTQ